MRYVFVPCGLLRQQNIRVLCSLSMCSVLIVYFSLRQLILQQREYLHPAIEPGESLTADETQTLRTLTGAFVRGYKLQQRARRFASDRSSAQSGLHLFGHVNFGAVDEAKKGHG